MLVDQRVHSHHNTSPVLHTRLMGAWLPRALAAPLNDCLSGDALWWWVRHALYHAFLGV
jgi:hypothetical protein